MKCHEIKYTRFWIPFSPIFQINFKILRNGLFETIFIRPILFIYSSRTQKNLERIEEANKW